MLARSRKHGTHCAFYFWHLFSFFGGVKSVIEESRKDPDLRCLIQGFEPVGLYGNENLQNI